MAKIDCINYIIDPILLLIGNTSAWVNFDHRVPELPEPSLAQHQDSVLNFAYKPVLG